MCNNATDEMGNFYPFGDFYQYNLENACMQDAVERSCCYTDPGDFLQTLMKPQAAWVREGTAAVPTRASASMWMSLYSTVMLGSWPPADLKFHAHQQILRSSATSPDKKVSKGTADDLHAGLLIVRDKINATAIQQLSAPAEGQPCGQGTLNYQ